MTTRAEMIEILMPRVRVASQAIFTDVPTWRCDQPPRICGCGGKVPCGVRCECQIKHKQEYDRYQDARRPSSSQGGYNSRWRASSKAFLSGSGHERYVSCGMPATMVDNRIPAKGDMALFWDRSNWQPMCRRCNLSKNARHDGGFGRPVAGGRV